jgi:hypothetical protein
MLSETTYRLPKLGVIIQGPLLTFGQGPNNSVAGFSSSESVLKNLKQARLYTDAIVVTTWSPKNEIESNLLEDISQKIGSVHVVDPPIIFDPDHRFKHHYGILKGAEHLMVVDSSVTHMVKIRTDMEMPESFWIWLAGRIEEHEQKLYVSELLPYPLCMGDFIYFASKDTFLGFLDTVIGYGERILHPSIGSDIATKYFLAVRYSGSIRAANEKILRNPIRFAWLSPSISKDWDDFAKANLGVLPPDIWLEMRWRGRRVGDFLSTRTFKFSTNPSPSSRTLVESFKMIALDYSIYWDKAKIKNPVSQLLGFVRLLGRILRKANT